MMKTNKTILASLLMLSAMAVSPAHAISAHYRAQLEKSGCTQLTDGNGCDIHKTKEQNAAAMNQTGKNKAPEGLHAVADTLIGQPVDKATKDLKDRGFRPSDETPYLFWNEKEGKSFKLIVDKKSNKVTQVVIQ